ncbi:MAG: hypothetical protein H6707_01870 [Deltaproteobacteria bacterium]|nr:hypothetical protein [Deltaproteobacteria bacterium]
MYEKLLDLTGFIAAHAVWSVSDLDDGGLIPLMAYESASGRQLERWIGGEQAPKQRFADWLKEDQGKTSAAVCVFDGYITLDDLPRSDCLFVEAAGQGGLRLSLGIPYRPAKAGFAVFRPKVLSIDGVSPEMIPTLMEQFWKGVDAHEQAAAVWNAALDQSK